ncbi:SWIM zinc finger family protein [Ensifer sp. Root954]
MQAISNVRFCDGLGERRARCECGFHGYPCSHSL